jgi:cell division cycle 14
LYYVALSSSPPAHPSRHFFSIDKDMVYWNFYLDFGPLNLGHVYRFCVLLNNKLADPKLKDKVVFFMSHTHAHKRTNAAFLICAWALMFQDRNPEEAFRPFKTYPTPFPPWVSMYSVLLIMLVWTDSACRLAAAWLPTA